MTTKKRAPRNRTLTLTTKEKSKYIDAAAILPSGKATLTQIKDKIFCGDILEKISSLPENSIDLLFIDPPYNLTKDYGQVKFQARSAHDYEEWFKTWFIPLLSKLKKTATIYVCCDWRTSVSVYNVMSQHLFVRNRITWEREKGRGAKTNWKNNSEDIWYATVDKDNFTFNLDDVKIKRKVIAPYKNNDGTPKDWQKTDEGNFRLTYPSNLWTDISIPFWSMPENTDHPTQKPEKLVAKLILASTNPKDLVFDPFMGSGTTAVVAKKLGRHFSGVEINPEYYAWAMKRLETASKDKTIQGYTEGVFWERNSGTEQSKGKGPVQP